MSDHAVSMHAQGPPSVILPAEAADVLVRLEQAAASSDRRAAVTAVVADHPRSLAAWAALGDAGRDVIERYSAYRVGYHRGLDALRASGWRGSGYVRWSEPSNTGFLRCLAGLGQMAAAIGEVDEAERIALFLAQLDPSQR